MLKLITKLKTNDSGATAIEYGLIAGLVAVGLIVALTTLGTDLSELFGGISGQLDTATTTATTN
ncbi:Flp family type IVb pilin [Roseovarius tibetensis]|uniref:Flp family type IVb pilin n=1 Tax=Roseovarius tibetensis TaxID=2685897 RepID=UPI003D7F9432